MSCGPPQLVRRHGRVAPLSSTQEGIWRAHTAGPLTAKWNLPLVVERGGRLDATALRAALDMLVVRHEILRTRYELRGSQPVQIIEDPGHVPVTVHDAWQEIERAAIQPFDLERALPLRAALWRGPDADALLVCLHHVAADGWSLALLAQELWSSYDAALSGKPDARPPLELQYADFAAWERDVQATPGYQHLVAARAGQLRGLPPALRLGHPGPVDGVAGGGGQICMTLPEPVSAAVRAVARRLRVTPYVVLISAFAETVRRWSGEPRFALGTVVVNRPVAALEPVIGCFASLAPIRCVITPGDTFAQLCTAMRAEFTELLRHEAVPVKHLAALLPGIALAKVGFVVLNTRLPHAGRSVPLSRMMLPTGIVKSQFALLVEPGDTITITAEFNTAHYPPAVAAGIVATLRAVLTAALAHPDTVVADLPGECSPRPDGVPPDGHCRAGVAVRRK